MPISVAGNNARERGFTLIELMIVIAIIGLASAVVVLALPDPRGRLTDEAARFAARTRAAHDLAVVGARCPRAAMVLTNGRTADGWRWRKSHCG